MKSPHRAIYSLYLVFCIAHCADLFPQIIYLISHSITLLCGWCMLLNSSVISILSRIDAKKAKVVFRCFGCGRKSLISYRTRLSRSFLFAISPSTAWRSIRSQLPVTEQVMIIICFSSLRDLGLRRENWVSNVDTAITIFSGFQFVISIVHMLQSRRQIELAEENWSKLNLLRKPECVLILSKA